MPHRAVVTRFHPFRVNVDRLPAARDNALKIIGNLLRGCGSTMRGLISGRAVRVREIASVRLHTSIGGCGQSLLSGGNTTEERVSVCGRGSVWVAGIQRARLSRLTSVLTSVLVGLSSNWHTLSVVRSK